MTLTTRILLALVAGLALGAGLAAAGFAGLPQVLAVAEPVGALWVDALRMTIVPLVFALLVSGVAAAAGTAAGGGLAARAIGLFAVLLLAAAAFAAIATPALLAWWPVPGGAAAALQATAPAAAAPIPPLADWLRSFIPANPVKAAADGAMAPLVVFALIFGLAVTRLAEAPRARLLGLFQAIAESMLVIIRWVLLAAPVGVFALALMVGARAGLGAAGALGHYVVVICIICLAVAAANYPLAVLAGGRRPWDFARAVAPAQAVALSTQSSLASLPAMLQAAARLGVAEPVAGVVLPMAVSIYRITSAAANMAVAVYAAHLYGVPLGPGQLAAGAAVAAVVSLAAVGLPSQVSFFTTIGPVCLAMGVPVGILPLLLAVETIPDICRTIGNVTSDVAVASVADRLTPAGEVALAPAQGA